MAKTNSNATLESLVSTLVTTHVDNLLRDLVAGPSRPIDQFALDGASVFVVYGANGAPLGFGGAGSEFPAASRNHTRRRVGQLASTGMITTFRSVALPSDNLVGIVGRMIGGLLGSSVIKIGDGVDTGRDSSEAAAALQRRRGRPAGSTKGAGKGRAGRPRKVASSDAQDREAGAEGKFARRRGRKPGVKNTAKSSSATRGPGRPPKVASVQLDTVVRRRGRPKKSASDESTAATTPKRRGRPPGSKTRGASKGRGQRTPVEATGTMVGNG